MTLKNPLLYLILLILCAGCEAFSPFDIQPPFNPRNGSTIQQEITGEVVLSTGVDADGCAVDSETIFEDSDEVYAVLQDADIPVGTLMFARLYKGDIAIEDMRELAAEEDYEGVCVYFLFALNDPSTPRDKGDYKIEFYINGNVYQTVDFVIR